MCLSFLLFLSFFSPEACQISIDPLLNENVKNQYTHMYPVDGSIYIRRGRKFELLIKTNCAQNYSFGLFQDSALLAVWNVEHDWYPQRIRSIQSPYGDSPDYQRQTIPDSDWHSTRKLINTNSTSSYNFIFSVEGQNVGPIVDDGKISFYHYSFHYPKLGWLGKFELAIWGATGSLMSLDVETQFEWDLFAEKVTTLDFFRLISLNLVVLADPLSKHSQTYMSDEKRLREYAFAERGLIWMGEVQSPVAIPWNFGPFHQDSVLVANYLLSRLPIYNRTDVVSIVRHLALSLASNANGTGGVLFGKWGFDYPGDDINYPWEWTGSVGILTKFWKTKEAVRYGQCWVFAGLLTTLSRSLGIPARAVTNFKSGSMVPSNGYIDEYFEVRNGRKLRTKTIGKAWNFHAWTETWISRKDIKHSVAEFSTLAGTFGWQAVDSTFYLGPTSVESIREATAKPVSTALTEPFDLWAMTQAINASIRQWVKGENDQTFRLTAIYDDLIGRKVYTKAPLQDKLDDVTDEYEMNSEENKEHDKLAAKLFAKENGFDWSIEFLHQVTTNITNEEGGNGIEVGKNVTVLLAFVSHTADTLEIEAELIAFFTDYTDTFISKSTGTYAVTTHLNSTHRESYHEIIITPDDYSRLLTRGSHYLVVQGVASTIYDHRSIDVPHEKGVALVFPLTHLRVDTPRILDAPAPSIATFDSASIQPTMLAALRSAHLPTAPLLTFDVAITNPLPIPLTNIRIASEASIFSRLNSTCSGGWASSSRFHIPELSPYATKVEQLKFFAPFPSAGCGSQQIPISLLTSISSDQLSHLYSSTNSFLDPTFYAAVNHHSPFEANQAPVLAVIVVLFGGFLGMCALLSLYGPTRYHHRTNMGYGYRRVRGSFQWMRRYGRASGSEEEHTRWLRNFYNRICLFLASCWQSIIQLSWRVQTACQRWGGCNISRCCVRHPYEAIPEDERSTV